MKKIVTLVGFLVVIVGSTPAFAQKLSWNPIVTTALAYDTNVFSEQGEGRDDWLGTLIMNVPVDYRPTPRFGLTASYFNVSESYRTYSELDDWQARSTASAGLTWAPRQRTELRLGGRYAQTNRPGEIFEDSGLELGRRPSSSYGANASLSQGLGARTNLNLDYRFRTSDLSTIEDEHHSAGVQLLRKFSSSTDLGVSWRYERRYSEARDLYDANIFTLDWNQRLSRRVSLSASAGTRLSEGRDPHPEVRAALTWSGRRWGLGAHYAHTLAYTPRATDLEERLGTSDSAGLTLSYRTRKLRFSAGSTYYWTRNESFDTRVWRTRAQMDFMPLDWLGFSASYSYVEQDGIVSDGAEPVDRDSTRHVARVGITMAPWNRGGAEGLP